MESRSSNEGNENCNKGLGRNSHPLVLHPRATDFRQIRMTSEKTLRDLLPAHSGIRSHCRRRLRAKIMILRNIFQHGSKPLRSNLWQSLSLILLMRRNVVWCRFVAPYCIRNVVGGPVVDIVLISEAASKTRLDSKYPWRLEKYLVSNRRCPFGTGASKNRV